jgi:hypothetical protein
MGGAAEHARTIEQAMRAITGAAAPMRPDVQASAVHVHSHCLHAVANEKFHHIERSKVSDLSVLFYSKCPVFTLPFVKFNAFFLCAFVGQTG